MHETYLHARYALHAAIIYLLATKLSGFIMAQCFTGPPKKPGLNLSCNIWTSFVGVWVSPPVAAPTYTKPCALVQGERVYNNFGVGLTSFILVDKGVDVHWARQGLGAGVDYIECPAGSLMYYRILQVESVGRGYPNEYLQVHCDHWPPFPDPLP